MSNSHWTAEHIPDQSGKLILITGANSGLGYESTLALAAKGAHVIMACRDLDKGELARQQIIQQVPRAAVYLHQLDLASLASINHFAQKFLAAHSRLDILMNNAGIMAAPYHLTVDGHELQFATNHLGHFALTGLLMPLLQNTDGFRVVTVYSTAEMMGMIRFNDLFSKRFYQRWLAYGQSKLANLLFALELQRRLERAQAPGISLAAHPGLAATNLQRTGLMMHGKTSFEAWLLIRLRHSSLMSAAQGALSQLYSATMPDLPGGSCYAPDGFLQMHGYPRQVKPLNPAWKNKALADRLWRVSEQLTGVKYL